MKYYIGNFTWNKFGRIVREYYISNSKGDVVAGDFYSYKQARTYLIKTLLKRT